MSRQFHLFDRATECSRLMNLETDHVKKSIFRLLRDMWIALANESAGVSGDQLAVEIKMIDDIQSGLMSGTAWVQ